ncbi:MAG: 3-deoxy-D-manno-octulosonic acid transferase [Gammaproteobacteria bacterium]|nr:MAG: 3-deoxy-D-manno-octulosonic acid transferase [Gammaproteobacteria bacterium]
MKASLTKLIYSILLYLIVPIELIRLYFRGRVAPGYRVRWLERFAINLKPVTAGGIWIHTASVGELFAALPVIRELFERYPNQTITVTTMTPTGSKLVKEQLGDKVYHVYVPFDLPDAVARFLNHVKPTKLLIMETELWPNIITAAHDRKIKIILMNARLSERSAKGYQLVKSLTQSILRKFTIIAAQHEFDAKRFLALGATESSIIITGSIKFDIKIKAGVIEQGKKLRRGFPSKLVWIAASTHEGEDAQILEAHRLIRVKFPTAQLIIVPRHPERFDEVAEVCHQHNFEFTRRSLNQTTDKAVYLGDTMGELLLLYAGADMAFVGGSLVETGGHNLLEPAVLAKPVMTGPHDFNFKHVNMQLFESKAAARVNNAQAVANQIIEWQENPTARKQMGEQALEVVNNNQGALKRLLSLIDQ